MKYAFFLMALFSFYGCPPQDANEDLIREFFRAVENGDTKWLDNHTDKNFKFEVSYLKEYDDYFRHPLTKDNFLRRNRSKDHYKIVVLDIKNDENGYSAYVLKSQKVMLFLQFESENWPPNSYSLPFEYRFGFKDSETLSFVAVDTVQVNSEHFYARWSNFQIAHEKIDPTINVDSLKNRYDDLSQDFYSYLLYGTNGWH